MLRVDQISVKAGRKGPTLLHGVSFRSLPGEFLVVLGANGSGKSTLLRTIGGDLHASTGAIRWKGRALAEHDLRVLSQQRAFLDQQSRVPFAFTAREIVRMGRYPFFRQAPSAADEEAVDVALSAMHAEHFQHRTMPSLSGGEQRRVHIARVLAQLHGTEEGALLMMDEPLNDFDIKHQHAVLAIAREKARSGACVIAVLHDVDLAARYADRILLMKQGRSLAQGVPAEVLDAGLLSAVYDMEAEVLHDARTGERRVRFGPRNTARGIPINEPENWNA